MPTYDTGFSLLPDFGELTYNTVTFSALYTSKITGSIVQDDAKRTTKFIELLLEVDGVVTLKPGETTTDATWRNLIQKLSAHAGILIYKGQGFGDLIVNQAPANQDVAFGPVPTVISFQPLGQGRSAFIKWQVITRISRVPQMAVSPKASHFGPAGGGLAAAVPVLQYSYDAEISYDAEGYSSLSLKGVLEIPLTRQAVLDRTLAYIVDSYRQAWLDIQFDLTKFRVVNRHFVLSKDKRRIDWDYHVEELPPMDMPVGHTNARGNYNVRPVMHVPPFGIMSDKLWYATMRCTYTLRKDLRRETALWAFYAMWSYRMRQSVKGNAPGINDQGNTSQQKQQSDQAFGLFDAWVAVNFIGNPLARNPLTIGYFYNRLFPEVPKADDPKDYKTAWVTDFTIDEGLYLDSRSITFTASWILTATFGTVIAATGIWTRPPDTGSTTWATSVQDIMGWKSWLSNSLDPATDVIVDMGGGQPPLTPPVVNP